ncbi:hypothetical protein [uncultured Thiodictyon sp.]|uniref:hypothetical protein n=1 Tax=uncultured Thiodictyon sp. TaxID=1846217 RepID=UPI0025DE6654|nr:hypothetical protein [uncultured Thiodictyon sp.]
MSLALAIAARARLTAEALRSGSPLAHWCAANGALTYPLEYRRPTGAEGWPFVAIQPLRDRRDLRSGRGEMAEIGLVCGYRMAKVSKEGDAGIGTVDALAEAVLAALALPWTAGWAGWDWDARTGERVEGVFSHPLYEIELAVTLGIVGRG